MIVSAGSGKLLIGQGDLNIQTNGSIGSTLSNIINSSETNIIDKILRGLAPGKNNVPLVGVVGGEGYIDINTDGLLTEIITNKTVGGIDSLQKYVGYLAKIKNANTAGEKNELSNAISISIGGDDSSPLILGFVGGDMYLNSGITGQALVGVIPQLAVFYWGNDKVADEKFERTGQINNKFLSGNILLGTGASSSLAIGNILINKNENKSTGRYEDFIKIGLNVAGNAKTILNGDVNYQVGGKTNLGIWANGGGAFAIGGTSDSIVNGASTLTISDMAKPQDGKIRAIADPIER